ncbi:hypothetical protein AVEN_38197-1 [Araneus ventricosus]|uniref:Uncharacterized protein n=1 Tax=Araneus ventricosus TaxID=182803 RepID=A0A4Y2LAE4_ARAVE|nr:hypothetical protein AVEN_38197-1 [Araneus ventricosus]
MSSGLRFFRLLRNVGDLENEFEEKSMNVYKTRILQRANLDISISASSKLRTFKEYKSLVIAGPPWPGGRVPWGRKGSGQSPIPLEDPRSVWGLCTTTSYVAAFSRLCGVGFGEGAASSSVILVI